MHVKIYYINVIYAVHDGSSGALYACIHLHMDISTYCL